MNQSEMPYSLYLNGAYSGVVWLTQTEALELKPIGKNANGMLGYVLKSNVSKIQAIYYKKEYQNETD